MSGTKGPKVKNQDYSLPRPHQGQSLGASVVQEPIPELRRNRLGSGGREYNPQTKIVQRGVLQHDGRWMFENVGGAMSELTKPKEQKIRKKTRRRRRTPGTREETANVRGHANTLKRAGQGTDSKENEWMHRSDGERRRPGKGRRAKLRGRP